MVSEKSARTTENMVVLTFLNNRNNIDSNSLILYFPFSFNTWQVTFCLAAVEQPWLVNTLWRRVITGELFLLLAKQQQSLIISITGIKSGWNNLEVRTVLLLSGVFRKIRIIEEKPGKAFVNQMSQNFLHNRLPSWFFWAFSMDTEMLSSSSDL